jgi:hypothetical protein
MEHITFDFLLGFLLAVGLMVALWVPLFFFDFRAEEARGAPVRILRARLWTRSTSTDRPAVGRASSPNYSCALPQTGS